LQNQVEAKINVERCDADRREDEALKKYQKLKEKAEMPITIDLTQA